MMSATRRRQETGEVQNQRVGNGSVEAQEKSSGWPFGGRDGFSPTEQTLRVAERL